jgi:hypothetical protein
MDCGACPPYLRADDPQMPEGKCKVFVAGRREKKWQVCGAKADEAIGGETIRVLEGHSQQKCWRMTIPAFWILSYTVHRIRLQ